MAYNGSGTFNITTAGQPVITGTVISSTAFNALTADLATGLTTAITKDGQTTTTARVPFAQGVSSTLVTDATSATTGSIITAGGISMQKALWVGTTSTLAGTLTAAAANFSGTVALTGAGGMTLTNAQNGFTGTQITNSSAGASAYTGYQLNNGTITGGIYLGGTGNADPNLITLAASSGGSVRIQPTGGSGITQFYTNGSESARFDTSGNLLINTTAVTQQEKLRVNYAGNTNQGITISDSANHNNSQYVNFWTNGAVRGSVTNNSGTGVLYNVTSDQRLKTNVSDAAPASALIDAIQVRQFNWVETGDHHRYGMVAQELLEVAPEAVSVPTDPDQMMGVDYSKLVPMLIKEVQSLRTRLAALESN
jgi:hypothetical protein